MVRSFESTENDVDISRISAQFFDENALLFTIAFNFTSSFISRREKNPSATRSTPSLAIVSISLFQRTSKLMLKLSMLQEPRYRSLTSEDYVGDVHYIIITPIRCKAALNEMFETAWRVISRNPGEIKRKKNLWDAHAFY